MIALTDVLFWLLLLGCLACFLVQQPEIILGLASLDQVLVFLVKLEQDLVLAGLDELISIGNDLVRDRHGAEHLAVDLVQVGRDAGINHLDLDLLALE